MCGRCCSLDVPVSLLDIFHIAQYENQNPEEIFCKIIDIETAKKLSELILAKKEEGTCIYLGEDNLCTIHEYKPYVCRFNQCQGDKNPDNVSFSLDCSRQEKRQALWQYRIALDLTKKYIFSNGIKWNERKFFKSIEKTEKLVENIDEQKNIIIQQAPDLYQEMENSCLSCNNHGICRQEAYITLPDISRISKYLEIDYETFFHNYIAGKNSDSMQRFKLKNGDNCVFYNQLSQECRIKDVAPFYCYLTPCPGLVKNISINEVIHKYQISVKFTREYIAEFGYRYKESIFINCLNKIDKLIEDSQLSI